MLKSAILTAFVLLSYVPAHAQTTPHATYGLHLFFDEKEYVDVLTMTQHLSGHITGEMEVPNDFTSPLMNAKIDGADIQFDVFVPKNAARPQDLVFHYDARCFDRSCNQLVGYVRIKEDPDFVASFVAFRRADKNLVRK
jgi:hypothetical protein